MLCLLLIGYAPMSCVSPSRENGYSRSAADSRRNQNLVREGLSRRRQLGTDELHDPRIRTHLMLFMPSSSHQKTAITSPSGMQSRLG